MKIVVESWVFICKMYHILLIQKKHQISEEKLKFVAKQTQGLSGADMENITNESAYLAIEK